MEPASQTALMVFTSVDGGASWTALHTITTFTSFAQRAYFRNSILFAAGIDGAGTVYLIWVDCLFEPNCNSNDLVMTTSTDGIIWSPILRIPIAPIGSGVNYSVVGLGIDQDAARPTAHLGLAFYSYAAHCFSNCQISVDFISSFNGGITWNTSMRLAGPFPVNWAAAGNNQVGDYICVSFSGGKAFPIFALATAPSDGHLNEAMYTMAGGLTIEVPYKGPPFPPDLK